MPLTIFAKPYILNVWQGSEYTSVLTQKCKHGEGSEIGAYSSTRFLVWSLKNNWKHIIW